MVLPNLSNSMYVAWLRYLQSFRESPERRNPDTLVRHFVPTMMRLRTACMPQEKLARLRSDPFYYYLLARTRHYDRLVLDSADNGIRRIISVGSGSDTRAYRFKDVLHEKGITVLECDQAESIWVKQRIARRWRCKGLVEYLSINLNDDRWPEFEMQLESNKGAKTLLMMEGVSPYVDKRSFHNFLEVIARGLRRGSYVAYDYKLAGVREHFGIGERTRIPFRMSANPDDVATYHNQIGLRVINCQLSGDLCTRFIPGLNESGGQPFEEDGLVLLDVTA